jgi:hypothetical protein
MAIDTSYPSKSGPSPRGMVPPMTLSRAAFVVATCAALTVHLPMVHANPDAAPAAGDDVARIDALHARRHEPGVLAEERSVVDAAVARAPRDHAVLWRAARCYFWIGDDPDLSVDARSAAGKMGWELGDRAVAANPDGVAGHYYAALNIGTYAVGLGVIKALAKGIDGKFRQRLQRAEALDASYDWGGVQIAWGRYHDKLPWPKRDAKKSEQRYRRALATFPQNLRARLYYAELLVHEDRASEARALLEEIRRAPAGRYDLADEKRARRGAERLLAKLAKR